MGNAPRLRNEEPRHPSPQRGRLVWMRLLCLLVIGSAMGCESIPHHTSYDSPEDTLLTFQSAFVENRTADEYKCLSKEFKTRRTGRFTLQEYDLYRATVLQDYPHIALVLETNNLADNVVSVERLPDDENIAHLTLEVYGQTAVFWFINERVVKVVFDDGSFEEGYLIEPYMPIVHLNQLLRVPTGDTRIPESKIERIRSWAIEDRWKLLDLLPVEDG